jgi:uncharacterized protein (DUF58 family)/transglutaminase-like putative cysteine protease
MLTRLGVRLLLAAVLALFGAMTSGANLLYLVDGMLWSLLAVGWWRSGRNLAAIAARAVFPEQVFQGTEFPLGLTLRKEKGSAAHFLRVRTPTREAFVPILVKGGEAVVALPSILPRRGLNEIGDVWLESDFPFGLFRRRRRVTGLVGLVFPRVFEIYGRQMSPAVRAETVSLPRRGVGEDFHGLRKYGEGEDARLINWKLTAKTGTPLVKEYAEQVGNRITITVEDPAGPDAERHISEAASLAKYFIDTGADVRLRTPEATVEFGHGLVHLGLIFKTLALLGRGKIVERFETPLPKEKTPAFAEESPLSPYAYLTIAVAYGALFLIEEINPGLLVACAAIIPLGWNCDRRGRYPLPRLLFDILGGFFLLFFLLIDLPWSGTLRAVTHLILFILAYLLLNPKIGRASGQLLTASFLVFFLASGQALSLWYFAFFLVFFPAVGAWLIDRRDPRPRPRRPVWRRPLAQATAASMILASLAFIVLPRPANARIQQLLAGTGLTRFQLSRRNFSGLADQVELGYLSPIRKNSARVMRVGLEGAGETSRPPYIRVRGGAFDDFDGRRWSKSHPDFTYRLAERAIETRHARAWMRRERGIVYGPTYDPEKPVRTEEYVLNPLMNTNLVFTIGAPAIIETTFPGVYFDFTDTVYFPNAYPEGLRYRIRTQEAEPNLSRAIEGYEEFLQTAYLRLPGPDDRLRTLAEQMTSGASGAAAKAQALESRLRNEYSYSLTAAHGRQDVGGFLFDSKAGNCEYFASAMCLLLRHLGIPSRLAVGFLSDEWNAYGKFFDVRQSDAHAWVEAYLPNRGWTTFDPTPADLSAGGTDSFLTRIWGGLTQSFDALQFRWYRYVVGYDTFTQRNFFYTLLLKIGASIIPLLIGAVLIAAAAAFLLIGKPWRRIRPRRGRRGESDDFFGALLNRLVRTGFPRRPAQTAAEYAEAVGRDHPELRPLSGLAARHYEVRYAGRPLSPAEESDVRRSSDEIVAASRRLNKRRNRHRPPA